tara:strand:- start:119591 stop:119941 length:351 start_codon:yes stop_codon:yes gene_type:complete
MTTENKSQFWIKFVLLFGFLLQFFIAFLFFYLSKGFDLFSIMGTNINLLLRLLFSLMVAAPLGFMAANLIFHHLPFVRQEMKKVGDYKATQIILLKLLCVSLFFVGVVSLAAYFFI